MKKYLVLVIFWISVTQYSCVNDLNTIPLDPNVLISERVFDSPESYKLFLAKLYAGFAVTGQEGPAGKPDVLGIDEGFSQYLRMYWYHQELPTDEAVIGWNDQTIANFHNLSWTSSDGFTFGLYSRIFYQIVLTNEFLRETTDDKLTERGVDANLKNEIALYRAEARFIRALSYWHALDLFRSVPFVTENDKVGSFFPQQISAVDLFAYIESELKDIENQLLAPRTNEYARVDKAGAWMVLAKLYLNAQQYIGQNKYNECLDYCKKVIDAGYIMEPNYSHLFLADNHKSKEVIFPIAFDGNLTRTYGGTTFIIRAGIGGTIDPKASGMAGGWGGTRATKEFVAKFPQDLTGTVVDFQIGKNLPKLYIPGSFQANPFDGTDATNAIAAIVGNRVYEGYRYFPNDNDEFVILQNPSSTLAGKIGDNNGDGTLDNNGANIKVPSKGYYYIKVDLSTKTYVLEKQNWSINGSAIPGGNGNDIPFVYDAQTGLLVANVELSFGSIKFRANNNNTVTLGDNSFDGILDVNGAEIQITKPGTYKVSLNLTKPEYIYQLQLTSFDKRGIFGTKGQTLEINDLTTFTDGYAVLKFKNITSTGAPGSNTEYPDTDFPMFRLADAYLMASEAILKGADGNISDAVQYFNVVRERAYSGAAGNVTQSELNLDLILDERAREFYWECHRRTDLVRFNKLTTSDYIWAWKGGVKQGQAVDSKFNIFPIPAADLTANPNLVQNPGY